MQISIKSKRGQTGTSMETSVVGIVFALVVILFGFLMFEQQGAAAALPYGPNNNNLCENQFTHAEYGYPNRLEGTPMFPSYMCYYAYPDSVQACEADPSGFPAVVSGCKVISPSNTAALESCYRSTIFADNSSYIENCAVNVPYCIKGESNLCPPCEAGG
jgi:hypothetical protein